MKVISVLALIGMITGTVNAQVRCFGDEYTCANGDCISKRSVCNGRKDCFDGSDEPPILNVQSVLFLILVALTIECGVTGDCIAMRNICDGFNNCFDGTDEVCSACAESEWRCNSGQCINQTQVCDLYYDCTDRSDETVLLNRERCTARFPCPGDRFPCDSGSCIPREFVCDGMNDCFDESDETWEACRCPDTHFRCPSDVPYKRCIPKEYWCDGRFIDCADDGLDEYNCGSVSPSTTARIQDSSTIS